MDVFSYKGRIMSYQTGTATGINNLLTTLFTFAAANGWTVDQAVGASDGFMRRDNVYVGFEYTSDEISIYQARGYTSASPLTAAGGHTNSVHTNGASRMVVNALSGAFDAYHFFESDTYIHVVIEVGEDLFRHFGFGVLSKIGSWTGGEYSYGHNWSQSVNNIFQPTSSTHKLSFDDGAHGSEGYRGFALYGTKTSGDALPGGGSTSPITKWYRATGSLITDGDGVNAGYLVVGGWRDTAYQHFVSRGASDLNGYFPLSPIPVFITDKSATPDVDYLMGYIPDVRLVNLKALNTGQSYTIGSDTWVPFPVGRKGLDGVTSPVAEYTRNWGYMYKKVTA